MLQEKQKKEKSEVMVNDEDTRIMNRYEGHLFKKNKQILTAGLTVIGFLLIIALIFIHYGWLKEPVFLYHYYETELPQDEPSAGEGFTLYYLSNRADTRKVYGVSFKEAPEVMFYATEEKPQSGFMVFQNNVSQTGERYGGYTLHSVSVMIPSDRNTNSMDGLQLTQATFDFTDGTKYSADIGRIVLYKPDYTEIGLSSHSGTSSSDGTFSTDYNVKADLTLFKIDSPLMDKVDKLFDIKADGYPVSEVAGREYGRDSRLVLSGNSKKPGDIIEQLSIYQLRPELYYNTLDGKFHRIRLYDFDYNVINRRFTQFEIIRYLRAREVL